MSATVLEKTALDEALAHCERITRKRARNFYYGLKLAPEPKRSALYVLYAWMCQADDIVDRARHTSAKRVQRELEEFQAATEDALNGAVANASDDPLWRAFAHLGGQYPLRADEFRAMLEGQLEDVTRKEYATFDELSAYCYRVASTVGLLCLAIWGYDDAGAPAHAIDRGIAFQLTNILRDFSEDYDAGRVYLPVEDFRRHAVTPQQVRTWSEPKRCERFWAGQVARAESYYERSRPLDEMVSPDCVPVLWAMTEIYASILAKMKEHPQRTVTGRRVRLSTFRKSMIALEARRLRKTSP